MTDSRMIPGLSLEPQDRGRGTSTTAKARFDKMDGLLESIYRASGLSGKLVWSGTGPNFVYTVDEGADLSDKITISTEFGNAKGMTFLDDIGDMVNVLYVAGADTGADRLIEMVYLGTVEPSGMARREGFLDASDCTTSAELIARGQEALISLGESISLEVDYTEGKTFVLGKDFDIGDTVTITYPGVVEVVSRIISSKEEFAPGQPPKVTLEISKEIPDLKSVMKIVKKDVAMAGRK
jgi:hypothetical protein